MPRAFKAEYAAYRGDELIAVGKANELAIELGVKVSTIYFYASGKHKERYNPEKAIMLYKLDDTEE